MLKKTLAIVGVTAAAALAALAALSLYAASRPDTFRVQRTASIQAPPERIHALIDDLHRFNTWNPFDKKMDPAIQGRYRGADHGPGAAYAFEGKQAGKGSLEIVDSVAPGRVAMKLDMSEPIPTHNLVAFSIVPHGTATDVTWAMEGPSPFVAKLMGVLFDMDRMVGGAFESGLADLKALAEAPQRQS